MVPTFAALFLYFCLCSATGPCSDPTAYSTDNFNISGPCPNDLQIAPVGDAVQYRCDYEIKASGFYVPYWHITELSGSPFEANENNDHYHVMVRASSSISGTTTVGHTTFRIKVLQQYLKNESLSIHCGLCSSSKCNTNEALSENVISQPVELVVFSK